MMLQVDSYMVSQVVVVLLAGGMLFGTIYLVFLKLAQTMAKSDERFMRLMMELEDRRERFWSRVHGLESGDVEMEVGREGVRVSQPRAKPELLLPPQQPQPGQHQFYGELSRFGWKTVRSADGKVVTCRRCGEPVVALSHDVLICPNGHLNRIISANGVNIMEAMSESMEEGDEQEEKRVKKSR